MSTAARQMAPTPTPSLLSRVVAEAAAVRRSAYSPAYMTATLAVSDAWMLTAAVVAGFALWRLVNRAIPPLRPEMGLLPLCCVGVFACTGQYPGIGLTAVEHLRRICRGVSAVYLMFLFAMFLTKDQWAGSRGALLLAWALSMALVSGPRVVMHAMARRPWWGVPVVVIGAGAPGRATVRDLNANRVLGYRPWHSWTTIRANTESATASRLWERWTTPPGWPGISASATPSWPSRTCRANGWRGTCAAGEGSSQGS